MSRDGLLLQFSAVLDKGKGSHDSGNTLDPSRMHYQESDLPSVDSRITENAKARWDDYKQG